MTNEFKIRTIDITQNAPYEKYLYKCISTEPFERYRKRRECLEAAAKVIGFAHVLRQPQ